MNGQSSACWSILANLRKTAYLSVDEVRGLVLLIPGRWVGYSLFHLVLMTTARCAACRKALIRRTSRTATTAHSERPSAHRTLVLRCRTRRNDAVLPLCHCAGCSI